MYELIFWIIALLIVCFLLTEPKLTFKPFSLKFNNLFYGISFFVFIIGFIMLQVSSNLRQYEKTYREAYLEGFKEGADKMMEAIKKEVEKDENIQK